MKHLGDIQLINGFDVPLVDIITGGSPCQDLSVAGRRAGLEGERSGLFIDMIRIIKEMRENDRRSNGRADGGSNQYIRPRYMVWENVPGIFTSASGEDFRIVLEETAKVADPNAIIPRLEKGQRWSPAGAIMADGWSVAWRTHNAELWGVAQRRRRVSVIADFGGQTATEILFESESVSGNINQSGTQKQTTAGNVDGGSAETIKAYGLDRASFNQGKNAKYNFSIDAEKVASIVAKGPGAVVDANGVRRLTPLEMERLQGFPDGWTDIGDWTDLQGKVHKNTDFHRYRALGNAIAMPFWVWLAGRICGQYDHPTTMASLFDGIGGFPLAFSKYGCTPIWASEIEDFPIAVTKLRFPE